jgi:hypothetical protein
VAARPCELALRHRGWRTVHVTATTPLQGRTATLPRATGADQPNEQEKLPMKRLRIIGLALLALFALGAFAASMASAEEGVLPNTATGTATGGVATLETTNKEKISCTAVNVLEIKFSTDQKGTATIHFTGCKAEGALPANSLGDANEVILSKVNVLVCLVEPKTLVFGLLIQPKETEHIEVPSVGQLVLVKGAVIAKSDSANSGKEFLYLLKGKAGVQTEATECEINKTVFKHSFESVNDLKSPDFKASEEAHFTVKLSAEVTFHDE